MNKKISQLAEQAVSAVQNRPNGTCDMAKYNQKFAELIIQEVTNHINALIVPEKFERDIEYEYWNNALGYLAINLEEYFWSEA